MSDTDKVNVNNLRANMYGCLPCPKCGGEFRVPYDKGTIECGDCGFIEPIAASQTGGPT